MDISIRYAVQWIVLPLLSSGVMALVGVALALRVSPIYAVYVIGAALRVFVAAATRALSWYVLLYTGVKPISVSTSALETVMWADFTLSPAVLIAIIATPLLWQLRAASLPADSLSDPH